MKTASEYRAMARENLDHSIFSTNWLYALLVCLIIGVLVSLCGSALAVGAFLVAGWLSVGGAVIFLKRARKQTDTIDIADLFVAKRDHGNALLLGLLQGVFLFLWSLLFVIPGIVKTYAYSMSYYLMADHPDWDWRKCIDESRRLMNGNKWRLFCLHLSFLGWMIVGSLCFGIGTLWVAAYMSAAQSNFYLDLVAQDGGNVSFRDVTNEDSSTENPTET